MISGKCLTHSVFVFVSNTVFIITANPNARSTALCDMSQRKPPKISKKRKFSVAFDITTDPDFNREDVKLIKRFKQVLDGKDATE